MSILILLLPLAFLLAWAVPTVPISLAAGCEAYMLPAITQILYQAKKYLPNRSKFNRRWLSPTLFHSLNVGIEPLTATPPGQRQTAFPRQSARMQR